VSTCIYGVPTDKNRVVYRGRGGRVPVRAIREFVGNLRYRAGVARSQHAS
jgi:hypothetical protein